MSRKIKPHVIRAKCNTCEECIFECPYSATYISYKTGKVKINRKKCRGCMLCVELCPRGAIEVSK